LAKFIFSEEHLYKQNAAPFILSGSLEYPAGQEALHVKRVVSKDN